MERNPDTASNSASDAGRSGRMSLAAQLFLLSGATFSVFLAGGPQEGNLAAFLILAGLALVACRPVAEVGGIRWGVAGGLVLTASLALLPQGWLKTPPWRQALIVAGVPLSAPISPMPGETLLWLAILAVSAVIALFSLAHPMRSSGSLTAATAGVVICGSYAALALFCLKSGWEFPFDPDPEDFGFFRNRNHTSAFLVTGSVLALGVLAVAFRYRHWVAGSCAAVSLLICLTGLLFFTTSRGGIVALVGGAMLWIGGLGSAHRSKPLLVSFGAVFIAGILLFLAPQTVVKKRLLAIVSVEESATQGAGTQSPAGSATADPRVRIYRDTFRLIGDFPFTGTGLGTFRWVFPQYRKSVHTDSPAAHPESDWLMLAAEAGLPSVALLFFGIGVLLRRVWRERQHPYWPLRWALLCAALSVVFHGFVDVPAHRTALGWWVLVIAGVGLQTPPRHPRRPPRWQHAIFVLAGLGSVALGVQLARAQWFGAPSSAPLAPFAAVPAIIQLRVDGHPQASADAARAAIREYPMAERLYFHLALALLEIDGQTAEAERIFRAQALLNPYSATLLIEQAAVWLERDPQRAAARCAEAIDIQEQLDSGRQSADKIAEVRFREILALAAESPTVQRHLLAAITHLPEHALSLLERAAPEVATAELPRMIADPAFIGRLDDPARLRFLEVWYKNGDRDALLAFLGGHADWEKAAWPIQMKRLVDAGKHEEATRASAQRYAVNLTLPPPGTDDSGPRAGDSTSAVEAFQRAWRAGNTVSARRLLEEARAQRPVAPEVWRLSAALAASDGQWPAAWSSLSQYIRAAHLDGTP